MESIAQLDRVLTSDSEEEEVELEPLSMEPYDIEFVSERNVSSRQRKRRED